MGLIARVIEEHGISTVCVVMNRDIVANVKPPRSLFVRFSYGAPLGPAGCSDTQMAVIREALALLEQPVEPGCIVESANEWPE